MGAKGRSAQAVVVAVAEVVVAVKRVDSSVTSAAVEEVAGVALEAVVVALGVEDKVGAQALGSS